MDKPKLITVQVRRGDKNESKLVAYEVPVEAGQSVLGVLQYIYDHLDSSIGFTCSCRIGLCSSCLMRVNGKVVQSCTTLANGDMVIEPYKEDALVRDLVTELPPISQASLNNPKNINPFKDEEV
ncbi:MAG: 2Fe-2S iron-sulfur cluster binding domain-containing protein [Anaerolineales bacterium]|nr:2Fe-2S iron-sulfur cluster binding domain-containing protein [Desulfobacteraceae bacterium]MCK4962627.1 2Fe-2S iron-sulfur cluster binding domain-containing protein [Anaerolineales bacterium]